MELKIGELIVSSQMLILILAGVLCIIFLGLMIYFINQLGKEKGRYTLLEKDNIALIESERTTSTKLIDLEKEKNSVLREEIANLKAKLEDRLQFDEFSKQFTKKTVEDLTTKLETITLKNLKEQKDEFNKESLNTQKESWNAQISPF